MSRLQGPDELKIPKAIGRPVSGYVQKLRAMVVGDSVLLPMKIQRATTIAGRLRRATGGRWRCRTEAGGVRVYRTL